MFEKLKTKHQKKKLFKELSKGVTLSTNDFYTFYNYYNDLNVYRLNVKFNNMKIVIRESIRSGRLSMRFYLPENSDEIALTIYENKNVDIPDWLLRRLTEEELRNLISYCCDTVLTMVDKKIREERQYKDELANHIKSVI